MKVSYTFHLSNNQFELHAIDSNATILIDTDHPKYAWIQDLESDRLININEQGHFNSSKDYHNAYGNNTATASKITQPILHAPIVLTKLDDLNIDASLFTTMQTNTIFDKFCSSESGFLPGTNVMAAGAPGVGKCVRGNTMIKLRNKNTGKTIEMTIEQFHKLNR